MPIALAPGGCRECQAQWIRSKPWGPLVFTPAQYPYRDAVWRGPLIVLVDAGTGSAAGQFAAELQDNHAAEIFGELTGGAGCGYTDGGTPTLLPHSGAILRLPDCVRVRLDGTNAADGVRPDVLANFQKGDTPRDEALRARNSLSQALESLNAATGHQ